MSTPFERDIADQAEALRAFAQSALAPAVTRLLGRRYDRIVLTGMGSSHFAALPGWRRLADAGHPAGTCKMGPGSDATAVVDATGAVHGLQGLYVADASVMPSITRGNINLPTAMIGTRIAAGILKLAPAGIALAGRR